MTDTNTGGTCVKWVLDSSEVTVEVTATLDGAGNVVFKYEVVSGVADLNGFYIDINNDGGSITKLGGGNNMNGSDTDGDRLNGFDYAAVIGTVGGNDADTTQGSLTVALSTLKITSLEQLAKAEIGIRATSVGEDRDGSVKLADTGTVCVDEPEDLCDRPLDGVNVDGRVEMQSSQIANLTLVFWNAPDANGHNLGDGNGDQYYVVSLDVPAELGEDPDAYLTQLVADLAEIDPNVNADTIFKSVIVTDCHGEKQNYNIPDFAQNDPSDVEAADDLVWTVFHDTDHVLDENTNFAGGIEMSYDLTMSGDEFLFA